MTARVPAAVIVAGPAAWACGVVYYAGPGGPGLRAVLAAALAAAVAAALVAWPVRRAVGGFVALFAAVLAWWFAITPSNERDWQPEVAVTPSATIAGDLVTIRGVRNFDYRTEQDFVPRWETRTYDLRRLESGDLIAVYWAGRAIAHIMLSFGFGGRDYVAVSIETRKERGERYSTLAGFFRQYELVYVVADERDVIRVRTTFRQPQEDVYVYPVRVPVENVRRVFLDYVEAINDLHARPRFYNTLTTNCTTGVLLHSRVNPGSPPLSWKVLLSGYAPRYVYELGRLDTTLPFPELERRSWINARAHAAGRDPEFSRRIREGLPAAAARP